MKTGLQYIFVYLAWIALAIIGFWLILQIRGNLLDLLTIVLEDPDTYQDSWTTRAVDRWFLLFMGAVWVFCITLLESYFRASVQKKQIVARTGRVFLTVGVIAAISILLRQIL